MTDNDSVCITMRSATVYLIGVIAACVSVSQCDPSKERVVRISQGPVRGYKDADFDFFSFYGIPYATTPRGIHKFKAPLPAPAWISTFEAVNKDIACPQVIVPELIGQTAMVQEDCLVANVFVPDTNETNLPVAVYVHGGAFQIGQGLFFTAKNIVNSKKFVMVTFNYRLGIHGFLCLGTDDAPGNAGMKDQVALLRWVKENIASFGGNPNDVTIWGSSAGSASVDLLMLSPLAKGLFNKVIPESGASLAAFTVQTDPIANAKEFARAQNFNEVDNILALEEFYKTAPFETLFKDAFINRKDSTFLFSPCVEKKTKEEPFLEQSPFEILKHGNYEKMPILYGFANMEGLLRIGLFETWKDGMNEQFSDFLPRDLQFKNNEEKQKVAKVIKEFYFGDETITANHMLQYIDYFSDVIFVYPTLRAVKLHVSSGHDKIYLYEFSYVSEDDPIYTSLKIRGANHCAQSGAVFDGMGLIKVSEDSLPKEFQDVKATLREMWTNFITTGTPVPAGSLLPAWPATGVDGAPYMSLGRYPELRHDALLDRRMRFWDAIYEQHYQEPMLPIDLQSAHTEL